MNTPAHVIFSLSLLGRVNSAKYVLAIASGAVLPDIFMITFYGYEKLMGYPEQVIWRQHYHQPFWQNMFDAANSLPILAFALGTMLFKKKTAWALLFASMIIHCLLDFPVHHEDSHRHFFPFSDYRFRSPVSYWNPAHYGKIVGTLELVLFAAGCMFLWAGERKSVKYLTSLTRLRVVILLTSTVYLGFFVYVASTWAVM